MENYYLDFMQIKDIDDAKEFLSDCSGFFHLRINLQHNNKITEEQLEILKSFISNKKIIDEHVKKITLCVPYERIPTNEFKEIVNFHNEFPDIKTEISVHHTLKQVRTNDLSEYKVWDIDTIIKANLSIDKVCEKIKNSNLSPLETLAFIHKFVSKLTKYKSSENRYWNSTDQHFVGAFSPSREFVCAGYSSLEKEIIDTLNMPGLKCDIVSVAIYNKEKNKDDGRHARCMIFVDDKTYNIKRTGFDDATWDGMFEQDKDIVTPKYAHFMMPITTHEEDMSEYYEYSDLCTISTPNKTVTDYQNIYPHIDYSSKEAKPLDQEIVEKIHFNMLSKTSNQSFDELYGTLKEMAKQSYKEQDFRKYKGSLIKESLILSRNEAKKMYAKNNANNNNNNNKEDDFQM